MIKKGELEKRGDKSVAIAENKMTEREWRQCLTRYGVQT